MKFLLQKFKNSVKLHNSGIILDRILPQLKYFLLFLLQAYDYSEGRAVFASGSPFPTYEKNGLKFVPGQGNNAYIFPGVALGVVTAGIHHISDSVFLSAAEALADLVTEDDLKVGRMYPPLATLRNCSLKIAAKVAEDAYADNTVSRFCVTFTKFLK